MALSYWNYKDKDLLAECIRRGNSEAIDYDRRQMVHWLQENEEITEIDGAANIDSEESNKSDDKSMKGVALPTYIKKAKEDDIKLCRVTFHRTQSVPGNYIFLGHNGDCYYYPLDVEVIIPKAVLDSSVKDARQKNIESRKRADGTYEQVEVPMQRINYTFHEMVDVDELVEKLRERRRAQF